jgi:glycosyltransferase involved in cell wall biosynthesis
LWTARTIRDRVVKRSLDYRIRALRRPDLISVVMPVLNGEAHIADQLAALAAQTYDGDWELVVSDNGCTDRTIAIVEGCRGRLPSLTIADARGRRGLNHARNTGASAARGDFLAFCDADDVATPQWLEAMAKAARDADIVGGRLEWDTLNDPVVRAWRPQAPMTDLVVGHGFLRYAPGGNLGVWTRVAQEIGWDEEFTFGSSDHGFAWRAQLAGYRLAFAPDALMQQRFRSTLWSLARQHFRYGRSGPQLHRAFGHVGLPDPDNREAIEDWRGLIADVPALWASRELRGRWVRTASFRLGRLAGSVRAGVLCL